MCVCVFSHAHLHVYLCHKEWPLDAHTCTHAHCYTAAVHVYCSILRAPSRVDLHVPYVCASPSSLVACALPDTLAFA